MLTDDQGYDDIGAHQPQQPGSRPQWVSTPNLDKFIQQSMEFKNFYVAPMCSQSRAELLTGRLYPRTGTMLINGGGFMCAAWSAAVSKHALVTLVRSGNAGGGGSVAAEMRHDVYAVLYCSSQPNTTTRPVQCSPSSAVQQQGAARGHDGNTAAASSASLYDGYMMDRRLLLLFSLWLCPSAGSQQLRGGRWRQ